MSTLSKGNKGASVCVCVWVCERERKKWVCVWEWQKGSRDSFIKLYLEERERGGELGRLSWSLNVRRRGEDECERASEWGLETFVRRKNSIKDESGLDQDDDLLKSRERRERNIRTTTTWTLKWAGRKLRKGGRTRRRRRREVFCPNGVDSNNQKNSESVCSN